MPKEESIAISNWDASNPIQVTVVETTTPMVNWIVILNPDGSLI